ncbi:MAG: IS3 family transposase [Acidobacteria bacterium]|nr:IS3 family transposase [Acidobacteriota bacterium]MYG76314.1 IS3 family transposase [Acidobacteriota bacterium]
MEQGRAVRDGRRDVGRSLGSPGFEGRARLGRNTSEGHAAGSRGMERVKAATTGSETAPIRSDEGPLSGVDHEVVYRFMDRYRGEHRVATMARVLGVSRSGYYAWKTRPLSSRARTDELLKKEIHRVHARHRGAYGAPRIHRELQRQGWRVSRKRVARLMRELGIHGLARRTRDGDRGPAGPG